VNETEVRQLLRDRADGATGLPADPEQILTAYRSRRRRRVLGAAVTVGVAAAVAAASLATATSDAGGSTLVPAVTPTEQPPNGVLAFVATPTWLPSGMTVAQCSIPRLDPPTYAQPLWTSCSLPGRSNAASSGDSQHRGYPNVELGLTGTTHYDYAPGTRPAAERGVVTRSVRVAGHPGLVSVTEDPAHPGDEDYASYIAVTWTAGGGDWIVSNQRRRTPYGVAGLSSEQLLRVAEGTRLTVARLPKPAAAAPVASASVVTGPFVIPLDHVGTYRWVGPTPLPAIAHPNSAEVVHHVQNGPDDAVSNVSFDWTKTPAGLQVTVTFEAGQRGLPVGSALVIDSYQIDK
jgi:hypothetical protein